MVQSVNAAFRTNDVIANQTQVQFELSKSFFHELLRIRTPRVLSDKRAAAKLLQLSLIFGKYPGMFRASFLRFFDRCPEIISAVTIDALFTHCLVKYEKPGYLLSHFHQMNDHEIDVLMLTLAGKNLRKHPIFANKCGKKEYSVLAQLGDEGVAFDDRIMLRGLIYVKIRSILSQNNLDPDFHPDQIEQVYTFLMATPAFLNRPELYLEDIAY
jgi:hypothetical protein